MTSKKLLKEYSKLFQAKYKLPYPISWKKHCSILAKLLEIYTPDTVRAFFKNHLASDTDFVRSAGHSLESLISQIPLYITAQKKEDVNSNLGSTYSTFIGLREDVVNGK